MFSSIPYPHTFAIDRPEFSQAADSEISPPLSPCVEPGLPSLRPCSHCLPNCVMLQRRSAVSLHTGVNYRRTRHLNAHRRAQEFRIYTNVLKSTSVKCKFHLPGKSPLTEAQYCSMLKVMDSLIDLPTTSKARDSAKESSEETSTYMLPPSATE